MRERNEKIWWLHSEQCGIRIHTHITSVYATGRGRLPTGQREGRQRQFVLGPQFERVSKASGVMTWEVGSQRHSGLAWWLFDVKATRLTVSGAVIPYAGPNASHWKLAWSIAIEGQQANSEWQRPLKWEWFSCACHLKHFWGALVMSAVADPKDTCECMWVRESQRKVSKLHHARIPQISRIILISLEDKCVSPS